MTSIAAKMLLEELKPKELVVSQDLLSSHPNLRDGFIVPKAVGPGKTFVSTNPKTFKMINVRFMQKFALQNAWNFQVERESYGDSNKIFLKLDPGICQKIKLQSVSGTEFKLSSVSGVLKVQDGICNLTDEPIKEPNENIHQKLWGVVTG